jgi:hypothetical protein
LEISGESIGEHNQFGRKVLVDFGSGSLTKSPSPPHATPLPQMPLATEPVYSNYDAILAPILIAGIAFLVIIIIIAVGIAISTKLSRKENTIYAGETQAKDENEMGTVEVKSVYKLSEVYGTN